MSKRVLITGGAGFIGSHIADILVEEGYGVAIYDNLDRQVHTGKPDYLNENAEFIQADIRDRERLRDVLKKVDIVCHQAAAVGVAQSMYEIERYVDVNTRGTAILLDLIVNDARVNIEKLVVAGSMSAYGEGAYYCDKCGESRYPWVRGEAQLELGQWEYRCMDCGLILTPRPTMETKPLNTTSIYAQTKKDQEEMSMIIGRTYGVPTVVLRYFNVYGPRQSLNNPYTGVCSIFGSRIKNNNSPIIYEDGKQSRDFVHVSDIARANQRAIERPEADMKVFNVGTGRPRTIKDVADLLIRLYGKQGELEVQIAERFRKGDIRHCFAEPARMQKSLGFEPRIDFEVGMRDLVEWGAQQEAEDKFEHARGELQKMGLL